MKNVQRNSSPELVDLHVAIVPPEYWRRKLNYASCKVLDETVSAGFVRIHPNTSVSSLRETISSQIGSGLIPSEFTFLRHVGKCLALIHSKQEEILKSKDFLPPRADLPEILVLPIAISELQRVALLRNKDFERSSGRHEYVFNSSQASSIDWIGKNSEVSNGNHTYAAKPRSSNTPEMRIIPNASLDLLLRSEASQTKNSYSEMEIERGSDRTTDLSVVNGRRKNEQQLTTKRYVDSQHSRLVFNENYGGGNEADRRLISISSFEPHPELFDASPSSTYITQADALETNISRNSNWSRNAVSQCSRFRTREEKYDHVNSHKLPVEPRFNNTGKLVPENLVETSRRGATRLLSVCNIDQDEDATIQFVDSPSRSDNYSHPLGIRKTSGALPHSNSGDLNGPYRQVSGTSTPAAKTDEYLRQKRHHNNTFSSDPTPETRLHNSQDRTSEQAKNCDIKQFTKVDNQIDSINHGNLRSTAYDSSSRKTTASNSLQSSPDSASKDGNQYEQQYNYETSLEDGNLSLRRKSAVASGRDKSHTFSQERTKTASASKPKPNMLWMLNHEPECETLSSPRALLSTIVNKKTPQDYGMKTKKQQAALLTPSSESSVIGDRKQYTNTQQDFLGDVNSFTEGILQEHTERADMSFQPNETHTDKTRGTPDGMHNAKERYRVNTSRTGLQTSPPVENNATPEQLFDSKMSYMALSRARSSENGLDKHVANSPKSPKPSVSLVNRADVGASILKKKQSWEQPTAAHGSYEEQRAFKSVKSFHKENSRLKLWRQLIILKEHRGACEETRQTTMQIAKYISSLIGGKRGGARDMWKRRFYDEEKKTQRLQELYARVRKQQNRFQQNLTNKQQVLPRKNGGAQRNFSKGRPSFKNNSMTQARKTLILMADLRERLGEVKSRLAQQVKIRHKAEQDLRYLKQGVVSKKIQSHLTYRRMNRRRLRKSRIHQGTSPTMTESTANEK